VRGVSFSRTGVYTVGMETRDTYGIGFFVKGDYHLLCREGSTYRFHVIKPRCGFEPAEFDFGEARNFIETHPVCANISHHDIRVLHRSEVLNILQGKSPESHVKSLDLSSEEEEEEPLH
jgi:hypothetical protein